jgi:hypothetical protein
MDDARVQERGRDQAPPLAVGEPARVERRADEERTLFEQRAGGLAEARALCEVDQEDEDVDPDQNLRHERALALVGDAPHALGHP